MAAALEMVGLPGDCWALNTGRKTVALISSQGYIDWILRRPDQPGELYTKVEKETHLGNVIGFKMLLTTCTPATELTKFSYRLGGDRRTVTLTGDGQTKDGQFTSRVTATMRLNERSGEYEWEFLTQLTCTSPTPVTLAWLEYNNVLPAYCGWCFLYAPQKRYHSTLMADASGAVWEFPHQHTLHYTHKINALTFATGTWAGFFGEQDGSPVVTVLESSLPPDWAICDMYYDLHCGARPTGPILPGETLSFHYTCRYLSPAESRAPASRAQHIPITAADIAAYEAPRLELGKNHFDTPAYVDRFDDASCFRPRPPAKVWDREVGHQTRGSLRLTQTQAGELAWGCEPPTCIPTETTLTITALVKTSGCTGRGILLRARYHTFVWQPKPHVVWEKTLETVPVSGTTSGWQQIVMPTLEVPPEHKDYLIAFEVVLDGPGTAWVTDVDVDLVKVKSAVPTF